jgi:hypothetical protein
MGWYSNTKKDAFTSNIFYSNEKNIVNGKKVKEVYSTLASLCHAWASENVPRGRSGSSMFFENGIMYSYGHHYKAAKIYTNRKGEKLVLMNSVDYSVSTKNHLSEISDSVKHINVMRVPHVLVEYNSDHEANLNYFSNLIADHMENIFLMRGYSSDLSVVELYKTIEQYCSFFNVKVPFKLDSVTMNQLKESSKVHAKKRAARDKKIEERKNQADIELNIQYASKLNELKENFPKVLEQWENNEIEGKDLRNAMEFSVQVKAPFGRTRSKYIRLELTAEQKERITETMKRINHESVRSWKAGEISAYSIEDSIYLGSFSVDLRSDLALLRVKGNLIETSEGADVPLDHALRLLSKIEAGLAKKGERVGNFTLEAVSALDKEPVIVTIGCHKIDLNEARSVLKPYLKAKLEIVKGE